MQPDDLQKLSRGELIELARGSGVLSADALTRAELIDELLQRASDDAEPTGLLGLLGVAGELVAGMVDQRLHMPQAAKLIREMTKPRRTSRPPPPLPTVTLAEIYAAQGHLDKALAVLDEVIAAAPDHDDARSLRRRLAEAQAAAEAAEADQASPAAVAVPDQAPEPDAAPADGDADDPAEATDAQAAKSAPGQDTEPAAAEATVAAPPPQADVDGSDEPPADQPLPASYDVDEVVALATDPFTAYVYWELRAQRFAAAHHTDPDGQLVLRALTMATRGLDLVSDSHDIPVDQMVGDRFVSGLLPGAELRLCLGWNGPRGFVPLAIAAALQMPRDHDAPTPAVGTTDPQSPAATLARAVPSGPAAATATHRLRGYQAQLARHPTTAAGRPTGGKASAPLQASLGPLVVTLSQTGLGTTNRAVGGASELYGDVAARYGGASELSGGASDLTKSS